MGLPPPPTYPWYAQVSGPDLEQGDILLGCPVLVVPSGVLGAPDADRDVVLRMQNVVVMSHSCDLVVRADGSSAIDEVVLCPVYFKQELRDDRVFRKPENWNAAKRGRFSAYHVLNRCDIEGVEWTTCWSPCVVSTA